MIITTTESIEGRRITKYCGIVTGETIVGTNAFRDIGASVKDAFGGRASGYEKDLAGARAMAFRLLQTRATELGANAVVAVRLDHEALGASNTMLMVAASGTAVVVE